MKEDSCVGYSINSAENLCELLDDTAASDPDANWILYKI